MPSWRTMYLSYFLLKSFYLLKIKENCKYKKLIYFSSKSESQSLLKDEMIVFPLSKDRKQFTYFENVLFQEK